MKKVDIQKLIDIPYATDIRVTRRKGAGGSQEFFTPYSIISKMCDKISEDDWSNPNKTFLEPCAGSGNFILMIIYKRILAGIDWQTTLETLYAIELQEDNVDECKDRVINLLNALDIAFSEKTARDIMDHNLVCHDFFTWNFKEWREMTEDEIKEANKKKK